MKQEKAVQARLMLCDYLKELAKEKGITHKQIAEKTGFMENNVSRMLAGKYAPTLDNFIILCDAINTYFFIIDKNANEEAANLMRNRWNHLPSSPNPPISNN